MPIYYCPTTGCGNRITYLTEKPKICPKCSTAIADPLRAIANIVPTKTAKAKVVVEKEEEEDDYDAPIIAPARSNKSKPIVRKPVLRQRTVQAAAIEPDETEGDQDDDGEEGDGEPYNPREARRLARELAASIDPSTINIGIETDKEERVTFKDWCASQ